MTETDDFCPYRYHALKEYCDHKMNKTTEKPGKGVKPLSKWRKICIYQPDLCPYRSGKERKGG